MTSEIEVLRKLFEEVTIPESVWREIVIEGKEYPTSRIIKNIRWIRVARISDKNLCHALLRDIDVGEAEAITLALEMKGDLILLDETEARDIAEYYGLNYIGTVGCLVEAKRRMIISKKKPLLNKMRNVARYWLDDELYMRILKDNKEI